MSRRRNDAGVIVLVGSMGAIAAGLMLGSMREREALEEWRNDCRRNARRSSWRSPLGPDRRWAPWMRELYGQNGVYMIRSDGTGELLYIGESHTGRLFYTVTRHMWNWEGRGAGPTYSPSRVQIAVELIDDPHEAIDRQFELIRRLSPRDNVQDGRSLLPPLEEVPF